MKIVVFGGSGRVGKLVVEQLAKNRHEVVAVTHTHAMQTSSKTIHYIQADIYHKQQVAAAIKGNELVISCLGSWGTAKKDVLSAGMQAILPSMHAFGINRIITLTGAEARTPQESKGLPGGWGRAAFALVAPKILEDGEAHIRLLQESSLDFTVLRSPAMTHKGAKNYQLTSKRPFPWQTITRQAVADAIVHLVESGEYARQFPFIVRQ